MNDITLTAGQRRSLGQRGWRLETILCAADANVPVRKLLSKALCEKCYEDVAGALRVWDGMDAQEKAEIERRAAAAHSPEKIARKCPTTSLTHLIDVLSAQPPHRSKSKNERTMALIEAYREELALHVAFSDLEPDRSPDDGSPQRLCDLLRRGRNLMPPPPIDAATMTGEGHLTDKERARLLVVKQRLGR